MSYSIEDIETRKAELLAAMPELELTQNYDYGLQLRARDPETDRTWIVMRPRRRLQSEIKNAAEAIVFWAKDARERKRTGGAAA